MDKIKTVFQVSIPDKDGLTIPLVFKQDAAHKVWVDWGDGSYPDTYAYEGLVETKHTYASTGNYFISMYAVDEGYIILGGGWTGGNAIGGSDEAAARMLVSVDLGEDVVKIEDYAFRGCENLTKFSAPNGHEFAIGKSAFEGCDSLEEFTIPRNIAIIPDGVFANCTSLKKVTLPTGIYEIGKYAFSNCTKLTDITLYGLTNIGDHAFANCKKLAAVKFGPNCRDIGNGAFEGCSCLRDLKFEGIRTIGDFAFANAKSLSAVTFPDKLERIGEAAFMGCTSLNKIKMESVEPPVLASPNSFEANENLKIEVPYRSAADYRRNTNWSVFAYAIQ